MADLHVRNVRGRYPRGGVLLSDNILANVTEVARVYRIRLDDEDHPDFWMEVMVEVASEDCAGEEAEILQCIRLLETA